MKTGAIFPPLATLATAPQLLAGAVLNERCDRTAILDRWQQDGIADYRNGSIIGAAVQQPELDDCTIAALAHAAEGAARVFCPSEGLPPMQEAAVLALFATLGGTENLPAIPGLNPLDVLRHTARHGLDIGQQAPVVPFPSLVDVTSVGAMAGVIDRCGGMYGAFRLYQADMDAMSTGAILDTAAAPGSLVGGHMMLCFDFPEGIRPRDRVRVVTYDGVVWATWRWLLARAYCGFGLRWEAPITAPDTLEIAGAEGWVTT